MTRLRYLLAKNSLLPGATVTATGQQVTNFPIENVYALPISKPWVVGALSGTNLQASVEIDLGSDDDPNTAALIGRFGSGATVTVRAGSSANPDGSEFQKSCTIHDGVAWAVGMMYSARYWSIYVTDTATYGYYGLALLGNSGESPIGVAPRWKRSKRRVVRQIQSDLVIPIVGEEVSHYTEASIGFVGLDLDQADDVTDWFDQLVGPQEPMLLLPPDERAIFGRMVGGVYDLQQQDNYSWSISPVRFRSDPQSLILTP